MALPVTIKTLMQYKISDLKKNNWYSIFTSSCPSDQNFRMINSISHSFSLFVRRSLKYFRLDKYIFFYLFGIKMCKNKISLYQFLYYDFYSVRIVNITVIFCIKFVLISIVL